MSLIQVSEEQAGQDDDDVRVRAARFFLTEFSPTKLNYFIGNGMSHMMSPYGMKEFYYKATFGYFISDIGLIGEYVRYGVLFIVAIVFTFRKLFTMQVESRYGFLRFWALLLIMSEILGGMFVRPTVIIVITSVMYLYDVSNYKLKQNRTDRLTLLKQKAEEENLNTVYD